MVERMAKSMKEKRRKKGKEREEYGKCKREKEAKCLLRIKKERKILIPLFFSFNSFKLLA